MYRGAGSGFLRPKWSSVRNCARSGSDLCNPNLWNFFLDLVPYSCGYLAAYDLWRPGRSALRSQWRGIPSRGRGSHSLPGLERTVSDVPGTLPKPGTQRKSRLVAICYLSRYSPTSEFRPLPLFRLSKTQPALQTQSVDGTLTLFLSDYRSAGHARSIRVSNGCPARVGIPQTGLSSRRSTGTDLGGRYSVFAL